jgi:toxin-antitoxin system PIN domain toxin
MSFAIDVNILLYASDQQSPLQPRAQAFLEQCAQRREVFCLAWITLMGYLRMATHPRIFARPLSPDEAVRNVEALLRLPHCRTIGEGDRFWQNWRAITAAAPARGNLVPDAHLAAILHENGIVRLYTHDSDFRRYAFLDVQDPLV